MHSPSVRGAKAQTISPVGGPYWFSNGWNVAGMSAWVLSSVPALLTVNIPGHFVGWLGRLAGGVDVSLLLALILPVVLYPVFLRLFPEPRAIYGPRGSWLVETVDVAIAPVRPAGGR